jgi:hypothetical protein
LNLENPADSCLVLNGTDITKPDLNQCLTLSGLFKHAISCLFPAGTKLFLFTEKLPIKTIRPDLD